jgi:hypothetical protein
MNPPPSVAAGDRFVVTSLPPGRSNFNLWTGPGGKRMQIGDILVATSPSITMVTGADEIAREYFQFEVAPGRSLGVFFAMVEPYEEISPNQLAALTLLIGSLLVGGPPEAREPAA